MAQYTSHAVWRCPARGVAPAQDVVLVHMRVWITCYENTPPQRVVVPKALAEAAAGVTLDEMVIRRGLAAPLARDGRAVSEFFKANLVKGSDDLIRLVLYNNICDLKWGKNAKQPCNHQQHHKPWRQTKWQLVECSHCNASLRRACASPTPSPWP